MKFLFIRTDEDCYESEEEYRNALAKKELPTDEEMIRWVVKWGWLETLVDFFCLLIMGFIAILPIFVILAIISWLT